MPKTCKYYCEQCGDCLECYQDIECFYGADHTIELEYRLQEELLEKEQEQMDKYDRVCIKCKGKLKDSPDGMILDSYPSIYPVVCTVCGTRQSAHLTSQIEDIKKERNNE